MKVVEKFKPDVIFHCATWTAVDKAEDNEKLVEAVNVEGTRNLTEASIKVGAKMIYMSTDYVLDGTLPLDKCYVEDDEANPKSVYGQTKYEGESEVRANPRHFITRISCVFGFNGGNFIKIMLRLGSFKPS